jgi:hypothetical protein
MGYTQQQAAAPPPAGERNAELDMSACGFAAHSSVLRSLRVVLADLIACKYLIPRYIALHYITAGSSQMRGVWCPDFGRRSAERPANSQRQGAARKIRALACFD